MAVIDRQQVFVGSLNFDPRSIKINTEMGVFIEGGPLASDIMSRVDENIDLFTYRVGLNEKDRLIWSYDGKGEDEVRLSEPDAGIWRRIIVGITALLPVEGQL
jgi:putative cardiolipin synthase